MTSESKPNNPLQVMSVSGLLDAMSPYTPTHASTVSPPYVLLGKLFFILFKVIPQRVKLIFNILGDGEIRQKVIFKYQSIHMYDSS